MAQIATRSRVHYADSWPLFNDPNGGTYIEATTDVSGRASTVRQGDGLHLSREGATWPAAATYTQSRHDWQLP